MTRATEAFVRHQMLPQVPPPSSQTGIVKWLRENLFSSIGNSILTIASFFALWWVLDAVWPWLTNGVWTTSSLSQCREVLQGEVGACFSVLAERWNQLLFGFKYPAELYGRPTAAFLLLFIAAAPVLFFKTFPRYLLIVTAAYPFVAY